jgi:hypothetical protein
MFGRKNGNRSAAPAAHGNPDPSAGNGARAGTAGYSVSPAELARVCAQQNAAAGPLICRYQDGCATRDACTAGGRCLGAGNIPLWSQLNAGALGSFPVIIPTPPPPPPAPPLENAGISVGAFIGWRVWKVRATQMLLESYSQPYIWLPGEPSEGKPSDDGNEGIWAFRSPDDAKRKFDGARARMALGSVWLWGDVIEHADGYRAQFAEVRSLDCVSDRFGDFLGCLRARYGVEGDPAFG